MGLQVSVQRLLGSSPHPHPGLGVGVGPHLSKGSCPAPTPASGSTRVSLMIQSYQGYCARGVVTQHLGPLSLALGEGQRGTTIPCSRGPLTAMQLRALWFPGVCHQQQGQGHPASAVPSPQLKGLAVPAPSTRAMGGGLPGISLPAAWVSGQPWACRLRDAHHCRRGTQKGLCTHQG